MKTITATELSRNLRDVLDRLAIEHEEIIIERNHQQVARLIPGPGHQTALEAMSDLYRTLPMEAAEGWLEDARIGLGEETIETGVRSAWAS